MNNPKECFSICQKQTFFILNRLTEAEGVDGNEPLLFHHNSFSRFVFVIINANKKAVTANIPVREIPAIIEKIRCMNMRDIFGTVSQKQKTDTGNPAYTVKITAGVLKGKTPAEAFLENAEKNKQLLLNQKKWLQENLEKYPRNQEQITAIEETLRLYEEGNLNPDISAQSSKTEMIYAVEMRPLIRKKRTDGKVCVYEISMKWNSGENKPLEIEIKNYFAPVNKSETGLLNVQVRERVEEQKNCFSLTAEEALWMVHMLETNINTFEIPFKVPSS